MTTCFVPCLSQEVASAQNTKKEPFCLALIPSDSSVWHRDPAFDLSHRSEVSGAYRTSLSLILRGVPGPMLSSPIHHMLSQVLLACCLSGYPRLRKRHQFPHLS